jgi:glycerol kinase
MISWQDRRAADWCARHRDLDSIIARHSGLLLSPHYLGPKLASILEDPDDGPELTARLRDGRACIGTLDSWLIWHWSLPHQHQSDLTMAARTALADIESSDWSTELCDLFGIPRQALPGIRPTNDQQLELRNGLRLTTCIADQAAGAGAVLAPDDNVALVNFGTGAFVLYPHADARLRRPGYLTAPVLLPGSGSPWFVLEGTINGGGPALDRFHEGPTELPIEDDCPEGFAIPDLTGIGAPHWREDIGLTLSPAAQSAAAQIKRRIVLEGLLFRVLEILIDVNDGQPPERVLISGGVVRDPGVALGLAQLLGRPVGQLAERETTLLGAARLAAGWSAYSSPEVREITATRAGAYLPAKYRRWRTWFAQVLAG